MAQRSELYYALATQAIFHRIHLLLVLFFMGFVALAVQYNI